MTLERIGDSIRGKIHEFIGFEPSNSWFKAWYEGGKNGQAQELRVEMSEKFLQMQGGKMEIVWSHFAASQELLKELKKIGVEADEQNRTQKELDILSRIIGEWGGISGYLVWHKLDYLRKNNGRDEFGRRLSSKKARLFFS